VGGGWNRSGCTGLRIYEHLFERQIKRSTRRYLCGAVCSG
jgi:hypothetical protein